MLRPCLQKLAWSEVTDSDKHSSLLQHGFIYSHYQFYSTLPWGQNHKTLWLFLANKLESLFIEKLNNLV